MRLGGIKMLGYCKDCKVKERVSVKRLDTETVYCPKCGNTREVDITKKVVEG